MWMLVLLCAVAQSVWAQKATTVSTEQELTTAIADGAANIQLANDIQLSKYLNIEGKTVTFDLNGPNSAAVLAATATLATSFGHTRAANLR